MAWSLNGVGERKDRNLQICLNMCVYTSEYENPEGM